MPDVEERSAEERARKHQRKEAKRLSWTDLAYDRAMPPASALAYSRSFNDAFGQSWADDPR